MQNAVERLQIIGTWISPVLICVWGSAVRLQPIIHPLDRVCFPRLNFSIDSVNSGMNSFYEAALSLEAKQQGRYQRVDMLELESLQPVRVYLEGVAFALLLIAKVFTDEDGSTGIQSLVTSETTLNGNGIATLY